MVGHAANGEPATSRKDSSTYLTSSTYLLALLRLLRQMQVAYQELRYVDPGPCSC